MKKGIDTEQYGSEYRRVGGEVSDFDIQVGLEEVDSIRRYVACDFFDALRASTPILTEGADKSIAGKGLHDNLASGEYDDRPSVFAGASLYHTDDESWRLAVMATKMKRREQNIQPQRVTTRYKMGVVAGRLIQATKEVKVVRTVGDITVDDIEGSSRLETQRRIYERPMISDDCKAVLRLLERAVKHSHAA